MTDSYGGKPIWKWILLYLVIGGLVYGAYYYYNYSQIGGYESTSDTSSGYMSASPGASALPQSADTITELLSGQDNMTLYTFDDDKEGVSTCYDSCAKIWPPYLQDGQTWPANYTLYTRTDGSVQVVYKGKPLYYYQDDKKVGDMLGHGKDGVWHVATP